MFIHPHGIAVAVEAKNSSPSVNYITANFKALRISTEPFLFD